MSTTFLWTEHYGTPTHRVRERLSTVGFVLAVLVLAAGAAGLVTLQGPYALADSVRAALSAL
jgi:hypothetical protein